jgi:hypothetical protein
LQGIAAGHGPCDHAAATLGTGHQDGVSSTQLLAASLVVIVTALVVWLALLAVIWGLCAASARGDRALHRRRITKE